MKWNRIVPHNNSFSLMFTIMLNACQLWRRKSREMFACLIVLILIITLWLTTYATTCTGGISQCHSSSVKVCDVDTVDS